MAEVAVELSELYPDLLEKGGLGGALQSALSEIGSSLKVEARSIPEHVPVYARVEQEPRFSQIYIGKVERVFIFDFWESGIALGGGQTSSLAEVACAIREWLETPIFLSELAARHTFVRPGKLSAAFEQDNETEWAWQDYETWIPEHRPLLSAFFAEASKTPALRQLFPYTSLNYFCFSRCTGYPYSADCPHVSPIGDGLYEVLDQKVVLGRGDGVRAVELVVNNLPADCGRAVRGTNDDLEG